ncbi:MAG: DUF1850 domain-containing protein [Trueperaceae bacterium]|nr:DUF1850 domain-containing protein [Trueperaceae bacterium]
MVGTVLLFVAMVGSLPMAYDVLLRPGPELVVITDAGEELVRVSLKTDPTWEYVWTHSVAQVRVRDVFAYRDGTMLLTDQLTPLIDIAGLGHTPGRGDLRDDGDGGYWIADLDVPIAGNVHRFIIGTERAPTTLVHAGRSFELTATHPGVHARIEVIEP